MYKNFYSNIIFNCYNLETTEMSHSGMNKEDSGIYTPLIGYSAEIKNKLLLHVWMDLINSVGKEA